jgi:general stress protein 26
VRFEEGRREVSRPDLAAEPEPRTKLDARFSGPDAVATEWAVTRDVVETAQIFWLSTVRADGRPHTTPLVAVWLDGAAHFTTGPGEQKAHNLDHHQAVTLTTSCNGWQEGLDVVIEGTAVRQTDDSTLVRLAEAWAKKWDGSWKWEVADGAFAMRAAERCLCSRSLRPRCWPSAREPSATLGTCSRGEPGVRKGAVVHGISPHLSVICHTPWA